MTIKPQAVEQEPIGYFKAEPFGWTDCSEHDEGAIALYERAPDSAARIAELEKINAELLAFVKNISEQTPEKPDYWSSCGQCEHNASEAEDAIAKATGEQK